jgi:hypothetical protein
MNTSPTKSKSNQLPVYVLYNDTTSDYPGEWVVRRQVVDGGKIQRDKELSARGPTRDACELALFEAVPEAASMMFLNRWPGDDPCIAGTYL